ncbi:ArnT family glycosyltransferase [Halostella pelagica]|uniref:ArnT family glycosyltransferase n=1 Tax=Halostella pelagica TaxID=2583824 RepID=UPI001081EC70|nr:glycosyltransferase family 39 protein [Halostella pelagica]
MSPASGFRDHVTPARVAALLAVLTGAVVFLVANELFPYHSNNHDEGVYLQQAEMLLNGQLSLSPAVPDAVRPWFFVDDGGRLYPKYTPVPAAMFATAKALTGEFRVALAVVAAGNAALAYSLTAEAYDRRTGVVAVVALLGAPLFLLTSSVFLPYAPTALLNWTFALAYVRAVRERSARYAALAGVAVGLAFFARPYTAVLFAAPFIAHAFRTLYRAGTRDEWDIREWVRLDAVIAAGGLAFVGLSLSYNAAMTGSAFLFPYEAFAPLDGLGFGHRKILSHDLRYTPAVALRANAWVLWYFATRWAVAGPIGTLLAAAGVARLLTSLRPSRRSRRETSGGTPDTPLSDLELRTVLAGLFVTVVAGNVLFWGNYNVLATFDDPTDGLISHFGPFYHFDLLLPLSAFAASAAVGGWRRLRSAAANRFPTRYAKLSLLLVLVVTLPAVGVAERSVIDGPVERNAAHTEKYERAYAPVENAEFENALVFVPTPYGDWLNHPFQSIRNGPDFGGEAVYALDRSASGDFAVVDAYSNRTLYRYAYQGEWTPDPSEQVDPKLERLRVREAAAFDGVMRVGVIRAVESVTVRVETDGTVHEYAVDRERLGDELAVEWELTPRGVRATGDNLTRVVGDGEFVPVDGSENVAVTVTMIQRGGASITYREDVSVRTGDETVEVIWPPERSVCNLVMDCGSEGTYLPDRPETRVDGASINSTLRPKEGEAVGGL